MNTHGPSNTSSDVVIKRLLIAYILSIAVATALVEIYFTHAG